MSKIPNIKRVLSQAMLLFFDSKFLFYFVAFYLAQTEYDSCSLTLIDLLSNIILTKI